MGILKKVSRAYHHWKEMKDMPLRLEFILNDCCNLNCRGCTHYASLAPKEFMSLEKLTAEMSHLGKVCGSDVKQVYLIGGEPLLYPQLPEAMDNMRKAFPTQELYVFTNGLIIGKMSDDFWESVRRNNVIIAITRYPIKFDYDKVELLCKEKGVKVNVFADRTMKDSFLRFALDPSGSQNKYLAHFKCFNRGCVSVTGGYVYPCSISACVKHLNNHIETKFLHRAGDRISVSDVKSAKQILKLRDKAVPFCSYCKKPQPLPYALSKREVSEWVDL